MPNRREFVTTIAGAAGAALAAGSTMSAQRRGGGGGAAPTPTGPVTRRQVSIAGKRVRVIDVHCHCAVPEVADVVKGTPLENNGRAGGNQVIGPQRIALMDQQGVDVQALTINGFWWWEAKDRDLARKIVQTQNEGLAKIKQTYPDRFAPMVSVALQFPDLAAEQLEDGIKRLGLHGVTIGGHVNGEDLSNPKYDPFWAKAAELGVLVFMHPGGADNILKDGVLRGRGDLGNIIGNPLETTYFLSRLIFDGTLDKFPNLKICAGHGAGYLPSYLGRTEAACVVRANANCANTKKPSEYFKRQLMADTMVFSDEGLRHLVAEMGVSQIVYGTDVPFNWPVTVDLVLNASFLNNAEKEAILGGNLQRLLRMGNS
jgi:aminocarboxymuconate-semialdehyde decarboxylase